MSVTVTLDIVDRRVRAQMALSDLAAADHRDSHGHEQLSTILITDRVTDAPAQSSGANVPRFMSVPLFDQSGALRPSSSGWPRAQQQSWPAGRT